MITLSSIKKETIGADFVRAERLAVKTNKGRQFLEMSRRTGFFSFQFSGNFKKEGTKSHTKMSLARQAIR